ncbi:glycosyltransferase family 8 protein [Falsirhodobacter deserti]|uniref:glycosyltransferase family 8 protein n=1 Tax=Falsirhodobacter deserti TaxID=1365611 RepID=UPI0013E31AE6|nr:glycosyltransferase [Falsirhodobacter deserti]
MDRLMPMLPAGLPGDAKWPNIVYLRLLAPQFLSGYTRLIYLDADVLCMKADPKVWGLALPSGLAMVSDYATLDRAPHDLKGMPRRAWLDSIGVKSERYANSGMLLIDPAVFAAHNFARLLPDYFARHPAAVRYDQDFLNSVFDGVWTELGPRFNYQATILEAGYTKAIDPVFVHFCRRQKPWWGQEDNWFSPTDPLYTEAYDRVLSNAGFDPQTYRRPNYVKFERRIKYAFYRWLGTRGIKVAREGRTIADWQRRSDFLYEFLNQGLRSGRFADESRTAIPRTAETPWFDGRFVKTWGNPLHKASSAG